ncbi:argininosuccinate synthase [Culex quinquefasciatus]|uniref:Argininosuccinate synthase n=1 Tax=Culex quinquefasciatus TaxID=7176 RepID=B0X0Q1_CULQU|nr:argininosuccinate synthase [Culex quinquefasciatus]EDS38293.1 argininosuccinate synthase [Culex quinquefasciatus]|eukprot:XP_001863223.1 argininosuccinate synthase [Culex quinquefasciatus]
MSQERILLAYSGGLDTSCILKWLLEKGHEVICFMADVGQEEDFGAAREKALRIGATDVIVKDMKQQFVERFVWPALQMGLIYEDRYLLGTSLARPCISIGLVEAAAQRGCTIISHGATGKGNDQIRFELSCYALNPTIKVIAPWRLPEFCERFQGRTDLLEYAKKNNIPVSATTKAPWSMDANIMHISYESGLLEDPAIAAPEELYQMTQSPQKSAETATTVEIIFKDGAAVRASELISGKTMERPVDILTFLNKIGGEHGVGRIDLVENRFLGLKSRGVYETPGATILHVAHRDLEVYCLDREIFRVKSFLSSKMADYVYNGFWYSPEAEYVRSCLVASQRNVTGKVVLEIFKGHAMAVSRESIKSVYNQELASMDVHGSLSPYAATGFIEVNAMRLKEHHRVFGSANMK